MGAGKEHFSDPDAVARYAERPAKQVPGFSSLQKMAGILIAEHAPADANVLVLGAGGGLELKVFAEAQPGWRFCGVDPSAEMLTLARDTLGALSPRVDFHEGYIDSAPKGPFDAASCLLTMHFIPLEERRQTLAHLYKRLKPGAPFVMAHHSFPQDEGEKKKWLARYAAFSAASGVPGMDGKNAAAAIGERLPILSPAQEEALLREAGFSDIELFYAGFTFRGWVARRK